MIGHVRSISTLFGAARCGFAHFPGCASAIRLTILGRCWFLANLVCGLRAVVCAKVGDWSCMCASSDVLQFAHVGGSVGVEGVSV